MNRSAMGAVMFRVTELAGDRTGVSVNRSAIREPLYSG